MVLVARWLQVLSLRMVVLIVLLPLPRRNLDRQVDGLSGIVNILVFIAFSIIRVFPFVPVAL